MRELEELEKYVLDEIVEIHKVYVGIIDKLYWDNYSKNSSAFPFYHFTDCDCLVLVNDSEHFNTEEATLVVSVSGKGRGEIRTIKVNEIFDKNTLSEFDNYHQLKKEITKQTELGAEVFEIGFMIYSKDSWGRELKTKLYSDSLELFILRYRENYNNLMLSSNSSLSLKNRSQRYQYTKYDIDSVIDYFSATDASQLETLFEQVMFCYEHNKFLASAACAGIAIEELCILILEDSSFDDGIRNKNTTIVELGGILRNKGIITRRVSSILVASSIIRNSVSQSSSGYVAAEQTDILVATFKQLFEEYIKYKDQN